MMAEQFPEWVEKTEYWAVDNLDCATDDEALPICEACIQALVDRLAAGEPDAGMGAPGRPEGTRTLLRLRKKSLSAETDCLPAWPSPGSTEVAFLIR